MSLKEIRRLRFRNRKTPTVRKLRVEALENERLLQALLDRSEADDVMEAVDKNKDMSVKDQIDAYRVQMSEMAMMRSRLAKLKKEQESFERQRKKMPDEEERKRCSNICFVFCAFRTLQVKYKLATQVLLMALFQQAVRGDYHKGADPWPVLSYITVRKTRRLLLRKLSTLSQEKAPQSIRQSLVASCDEETRLLYATAHVHISKVKIKQKWKAMGGMQFDESSKRFISIYLEKEPSFRSFLLEKATPEKREKSLERYLSSADNLDIEEIETTREIYFGSGVLCGMRDVYGVARGVATDFTRHGATFAVTSAHAIAGFDVRKTEPARKIAKRWGALYNSKRVVTIRYRAEKMYSAIKSKLVHEKFDDVMQEVRYFPKRKRWAVSTKWMISKSFRHRVVRLQAFCRRLIATRKLRILQREKLRINVLVNRVIRKWRSVVFIRKIRNMLARKRAAASVINRHIRVYLGRKWRRRRWKQMHSASTIIQADIRRFIQRVPYDLRKQRSAFPDALYPGVHLFLRTFDGRYVEASMRSVVAMQARRSYAQRWTISSGFRRREKHSSYIVCSGEKVLMKSYQQSYLRCNEREKPVSAEGIPERPTRKYWWTIERYDDDPSRSSSDYRKHFTTHITPVRSGDLVRLVSETGLILTASKDGRDRLRAVKQPSCVIYAQQLFTVIVESHDLYPRPLRNLKSTLTTPAMRDRKKEPVVKRIKSTACRIGRDWVVMSIFSNGMVTLFDPSRGEQVRFSCSAESLRGEYMCDGIVRSIAWVSPQIGARGGWTVGADYVSSLGCRDSLFEISKRANAASSASNREGTNEVEGLDREGVKIDETVTNDSNHDVVVNAFDDGSLVVTLSVVSNADVGDNNDVPEVKICKVPTPKRALLHSKMRIFVGIDAVRAGACCNRVQDVVKLCTALMVRKERARADGQKRRAEDARRVMSRGNVSRDLALFAIEKKRSAERAIEWILESKEKVQHLHEATRRVKSFRSDAASLS
eukprot:g4947.t1